MPRSHLVAALLGAVWATSCGDDPAPTGPPPVLVPTPEGAALEVRELSDEDQPVYFHDAEGSIVAAGIARRIDGESVAVGPAIEGGFVTGIRQQADGLGALTVGAVAPGQTVRGSRVPATLEGARVFVVGAGSWPSVRGPCVVSTDDLTPAVILAPECFQSGRPVDLLILRSDRSAFTIIEDVPISAGDDYWLDVTRASWQSLDSLPALSHPERFGALLLATRNHRGVLHQDVLMPEPWRPQTPIRLLPGFEENPVLAWFETATPFGRRCTARGFEDVATLDRDPIGHLPAITELHLGREARRLTLDLVLEGEAKLEVDFLEIELRAPGLRWTIRLPHPLDRRSWILPETPPELIPLLTRDPETIGRRVELYDDSEHDHEELRAQLVWPAGPDALPHRWWNTAPGQRVRWSEIDLPGLE